MSRDDAALRDLIAGYIDDVVGGRRVVGILERLAVERHVRDLAAERDGTRPDLRFREESALRPLRFAVRYVHHTRGQWAGQPYRFDAGSAWIAFVFWVVFGWERLRDDGAWERRFDEAYICTARKQGKSMIAAILALFMFLACGEAAPEVYFGATQREQAAIAWRQAAAITKRSAELSAVLNVPRNIAHGQNYAITRTDDPEAVFRAMSRNDDEFDGLNPFCVVLDEIHAHPDSGLYDVMRSGMGARRGGLRVLITTRGARAESFCAQYEKNAVKVLHGVADEDSTFVFIATLDEGDDYHDEGVWPKANPNIGVTVSRTWLRKELQRVQNDPAKLNEFLRKHMNVWTSGERQWLPLTAWDACSDPFDVDALHGESCFMGVDLSKTNDYTAAALVFPRAGGEYWVLPQFWIPEATYLDRARRERVPIAAWVREGLVRTTPGEIIDQDFVKEWILEQRSLFRVREFVFDQAQSWKLCGELQSMGIETVFFQQSWANAHAATKETADLITRGKLRHGGNPVLRWMFTNVAVRENATGLVRLDKARSEDRIDGVVATVMAISRAMVSGQKPQPGIWVMGA